MAAWNFAVSLHISLAFVVVYGASPKILSITRSKDKGDSFELDLEPHGCPLCEQYGAMSDPMFGSSTSGCFCQCGDEKPTFYSTQTGQHACLKDGDVLADTQGGDICDFYTGYVQQLQVHDLHTGGKTRVKPDGFCEEVQLSGWKFYFNTSWVNSTLDTFFTISSNKGTNKLQSFLFWHNNLDSFYKGFLIKVMLRCTYEGKTDDRCVMFKAQGKHQYFEIIPTTTPVMYKPTTLMSFTSTTKKNYIVQKSTASLVEPTVLNPVPTDGYSKSSNKQIWLAVSLGLSGLVFLSIVVIAVCLWMKCRRNCKKKRTESHRHPAEQPTISTLCSATLHDYEYVHYPCLEERARTPPVIPRGNPMYERGADNKLIIWSPGHSGSLTRPHSQSTEAAAPRLPYQRLLTRTSSSTPDCSMPGSAATAGPLSPVGVEEVFPYQKLVRAVPSLRRRSDQGFGHVEESAAVSSAEAEVPYQKLVRSVPSLQRLQEEEQACGNTEASAAWVDEEEDSAKAYQSLSLQRKLYPLKECDGYAQVGSASEPESTEYDYARVSTVLDPVELDKLFRGNRHSESHGDESPRLSMEISIGDLNNTASTIIDPKRHSGISRTHSTSSCSSGDYENCTCKNNAKRDSLANAVKDNECVEAKGPRPAASYEDLSGSHRLDPEEYEEMGKRKSVMITEESHDDASEAEDTAHEYFVLEGLVEECEDETVDDS